MNFGRDTVLLNKLINSILLNTQYSVFEKHVQRIDVEICDYEDIFDVSREKSLVFHLSVTYRHPF